MAGGKQTPRQKMIGMMYLVLTALLALNVSKDILEAFAVVEKGLDRTVENFSQKNQTIYSMLQNEFDKNPSKVAEWKNKADAVKKKADNLYLRLDKIKDTLVSLTGGIDTTTGFARGMDNKEKTMNYMMVNPKTFDDEGNPVATQLKNAITDYRQYLLGAIDSSAEKELAERLRIALNTSDPEKKGPKKVTWENQHFLELPLAPVLTFLTKMQGDVRSAEADVVSFFASKVGATEVKVNKLDAVAISNSNYIITGDSFKSEIFVAAFDTTKQPKVFVYDEVDNEGQGVGEAKPIEVKGGRGLFNVKTGATGQFDLVGYVEVETPTGKENFPFKQSYTVAKPSAVISPTALNVLYRGLDNPISVSVPGVKPEDLSVSCSGCDISGSRGNYIAKVGKGGGVKATISVAARTGGKVVSLGSQEFRLKRVPAPTALINNKVDGRVTKASLMSSQGIRADMGDFLFDIRYMVTGYTVRAQDGQYAKTLQVKGYAFNQEVKDLIQRTRPGNDINFTNIRANGPDGMKKCNAIVFTLQ